MGAGYTGLSAAWDLKKVGFDVTIIESESSVGGLAGSFEVLPGIELEKFYHHWFSSDHHILDFLKELGLGDRIKVLESNTGLYYANSIFRLSKPLDLLKFTPLSFINRIRTGLMVLAAKRHSNYLDLEDETAESWIKRHAGEESYKVVWEPLLKGKFGIEATNVSAVWFWNKLKLRGGSRGKGGKENLLYFDGGFGGATASIKRALEEAGVKIITNNPVKRILSEAGKVKGVDTKNGFYESDKVLATLPLPTFLDVTEGLPASYTEPARQIRFLGNLCLVLSLTRSLSSTYWLNVADPSFPFVGVIEHTNFDPPSNYGGKHIAYLSKYLPTSEELFTLSDEDTFKYCLPHLKRIFPEFNESWVSGYRVWRANFSQPVITKHYSKLIPTEKTPIEGLWLSTMAQVYPEDRGTSYAVRHGRAVAYQIVKSSPEDRGKH